MTLVSSIFAIGFIIIVALVLVMLGLLYRV